MTAIPQLSAHTLAASIAAKLLSPTEVVQAYLKSIATLNPKFNAFCTVAEETALQAATAAETAVLNNETLGPLHGVPVAIKDITPTADIRTTYGCTLYQDHVPTTDALIVQRLKAAGAIVIGKTNTSEFAAGANTFNALFGPTRNPWNTHLTPGGSTGGGAAALSAGLTPLAEGTDLGGSLRIPAAFCGVVGLRPTAGLVPDVPNKAPWSFLSTHGPMARNAIDVALMLEAICGYTAASPISAPFPKDSDYLNQTKSFRLDNKRIGYVRSVSGVSIDHEIAQSCEQAALSLNAEGAEVELVELDLSDGRDAFMALRGQLMVHEHLEHLDQLDNLGENLRNNILSGLKVTCTHLAQAEHKRSELYQRILELFNHYDLLLTPTMAIPPFPVEQNYPTEINGQPMENYVDWVAQTFLLTLCSTPAASVPVGLTKSKLPIGMQIMGPRFADGQVLGLAHALETLNPIGRPDTL